MAVQEKTVTIGDTDYIITQLGAREGRGLWLKVSQVVAAGIREGIKAGDEDSTKFVISSAAGFVENIKPELFEELCETLGKKTQIKQNEKLVQLSGVIFDQHFAGNYLEMSKWLGHCLMINFANFIDATKLGQILSRVQVAASKFDSPTTSTGGSGESSPTLTPQ